MRIFTFREDLGNIYHLPSEVPMANQTSPWGAHEFIGLRYKAWVRSD